MKTLCCPLCPRSDTHGHSPDGSVVEIYPIDKTAEFQYVFIDEVITMNKEEAANMMEEIEMVRAKMNATNFNNLLKPVKKD